MPHWRILYYLLQFYLFATSGALAYLSLRAWLDRTLYRRKREDPYRSPRWTHLARAVGLIMIAFAAIVGALNEGATGMSMSGVAILRFAGYGVFLSFLPRALWKHKMVQFGVATMALGEILLIGHSSSVGTGEISATLPYAALFLIDLGLGLLAVRLARTILRIRLVDRLVIAFAVFSLLLAQMVSVLIVGLLSSFTSDFDIILNNAEKPLVMTLSAVLAASALIGFFLARDLSEPVTQLGKTLRQIGDGNFDQQIRLERANTEDELNDLAREVNRMAGQLKAADEMRSDFFSFVSHELRSPLTSIQGFVTTLESVDDFSPQERAEIYGIVHGETDRMLRMINELLDLSRIQSGKPVKLNVEWFDITRHLRKVAGIYRSDSQKHHVDLVIPEDPVWIQGDADKVDQIVINLMSNAIKYSPSGGVVTLRLVHNESQVLLSVSDEGVGMTADQCAHVFDKFYRVAEQDSDPNSKRLRRVEGSGIGLYLTRALVEAHSGGITVASEPGEGSTFTVTLPKHRITLSTGSANGGREITLPPGMSRATLLDASVRGQVPHLLRVSDDSEELTKA